MSVTRILPIDLVFSSGIPLPRGQNITTACAYLPTQEGVPRLSAKQERGAESEPIDRFADLRIAAMTRTLAMTTPNDGRPVKPKFSESLSAKIGHDGTLVAFWRL